MQSIPWPIGVKWATDQLMMTDVLPFAERLMINVRLKLKIIENYIYLNLKGSNLLGPSLTQREDLSLVKRNYLETISMIINPQRAKLLCDRANQHKANHGMFGMKEFT